MVGLPMGLGVKPELLHTLNIKKSDFLIVTESDKTFYQYNKYSSEVVQWDSEKDQMGALQFWVSLATGADMFMINNILLPYGKKNNQFRVEYFNSYGLLTTNADMENVKYIEVVRGASTLTISISKSEYESFTNANDIIAKIEYWKVV